MNAHETDYLQQFNRQWDKLLEDYGRLEYKYNRPEQENRELQKKLLTLETRCGILEERRKDNYIQLDNGRMAGSYPTGGGTAGGNKSTVRLSSNNIGDNVKITDEAIENVPVVKLESLDDAGNEKLQQAHRDILTEAAKHEVGTEIAAIYRVSDMSRIGDMVVGEEGAGKVKVPDANEKHIIVHNHPNGSTLSPKDVKTLCYNLNAVAVSAVTNDGRVHMLEVSQNPKTYLDVAGFQNYVEKAIPDLRVKGYSLSDFDAGKVDLSKISRQDFCAQMNDKIIDVWKVGEKYGLKYYSA